MWLEVAAVTGVCRHGINTLCNNNITFGANPEPLLVMSYHQKSDEPQPSIDETVSGERGDSSELTPLSTHPAQPLPVYPPLLTQVGAPASDSHSPAISESNSTSRTSRKWNENGTSTPLRRPQNSRFSSWDPLGIQKSWEGFDARNARWDLILCYAEYCS